MLMLRRHDVLVTIAYILLVNLTLRHTIKQSIKNHLIMAYSDASIKPFDKF